MMAMVKQKSQEFEIEVADDVNAIVEISHTDKFFDCVEIPEYLGDDAELEAIP